MTPDTEAISASLENYLETIFHIVSEKAAAKPRDIANMLGVNNSSVTGALRALAERELIHYAPFEIVTLTPKGEEIASAVVRRHRILRDFFAQTLGIDETEADAVACKVEHAITPAVFERFVGFLDFIRSCPHGSGKWVEGIGFQHGNDVEEITNESKEVKSDTVTDSDSDSES